MKKIIIVSLFPSDTKTAIIQVSTKIGVGLLDFSKMEDNTVIISKTNEKVYFEDSEFITSTHNPNPNSWNAGCITLDASNLVVLLILTYLLPEYLNELHVLHLNRRLAVSIF